jgi:signal transduction histidine kinase
MPAPSLFEQVVQIIDADIAVFDADLRYEYVNPVAIKDPDVRQWIIGKTEEEYRERRGKDPRIADVRQRALRKVLDEQRPNEFEEVLTTASGERRHFLRHICPIFAADGSVERLIGYGVDVTALRRADEAVRQSERSLRDFVDNAPFGIYRRAPGGRFLAVNRRLVQLLGYESEADLLTADFARDIFSGGTAGEPFTTDAASIDARAQWQRKDRTPITVRLTGRRVDDDAGTPRHWEVFVEDVTPLDAAQRALEISQDHLHHAQKMEAIGRMAGGIAHDFNNILVAITCNAELVLEDSALTDYQRSDIREISKAAARAAALTSQLLAFGRKQALQPHVLDVNAVIRDTEEMLRRLAGETVQLDIALGESAGAVCADPGKLAQVVMNLVVNARDATPAGGRVTVETYDVDVDAAAAQYLGLQAPGPYVVISVLDTGCGIPDAIKDHIFEPFFTTKAEGKGTGLGLATAHGVVEQSGGHICVSSAPGRGARFDVYLPRVADHADPTAQPVVGSPRIDGTERVLVVEDQATVRTLAERILTARGYQVLCARDASEAEAIFTQQQTPIDLLLTDVVMPGMSGRELAERLSARQPSLRVLYMSGYHDDETLRRGAESGALPQGHLLQKPFSPQSLRVSVREAIDRV